MTLRGCSVVKFTGITVRVSRQQCPSRPVDVLVHLGLSWFAAQEVEPRPRITLPASKLLAPWDDSKKSYDVQFNSAPFGIKFCAVRGLPNWTCARVSVYSAHAHVTASSMPLRLAQRCGGGEGGSPPLH